MQQLLVSYGVWGLIPIAFIDSGLLPLPEAIDALIIIFSARNPRFILLYSLAATLGSVLGCLFLYYVAARGGHAFLEKRIGQKRAQRIRVQFEKYEFVTLVLAALLPPPVPMKAFVLVAGVVEVNVVKFSLALMTGRMIRYVGEGYLAYRYGDKVIEIIKTQGPIVGAVVVSAIALVVLSLWIQKKVRKPAA